MPQNKKKLLLALALVAAIALVAVIVVLAGQEPVQPPTPTGPEGLQTTQPTQNQLSPTDSATPPAQTQPDQTEPSQTQPVQTLPNETQPSQTEPEETQPSVTEPMPTAPTVTPGPIEDLPNSSEHWLAAAMVMAVSLEHPDFEVLGIYAASATEMRDFASSAGAFLLIRSGGERILIRSYPLEKERTEKGTTDLFTAQLGFATFDRVSESSVDLTQLRQFQLEELSEMIRQSLLVSLYAR